MNDAPPPGGTKDSAIPGWRGHASRTAPPTAPPRQYLVRNQRWRVLGSVDIRARGHPKPCIALQGWKRSLALDRSCLSDGQWNKIAELLPGKAGDPGRSGVDNRQFVEAVLWI